MPLAGRPPKSNALNKNPKTHDWVEVPFVYNTQRNRPNLPAQREVYEQGSLIRIPWSDMTQAWWKEVRRMPHTVLWKPSDWHFALETAAVYDDAVRGKTAAAGESRQRQAILGTTYESRLKLRIRYIDEQGSEVVGDGQIPARQGNVTPITAAGSSASKRARLAGAD